MSLRLWLQRLFRPSSYSKENADYQIAATVVGNGIILAIVGVVHTWSKDAPTVPPVFWRIELAIIALGSIAAGGHIIGAWLYRVSSGGTLEGYQPRAIGRRWLSYRTEVIRSLMWPLSVLQIIGLYVLVADTGGGIGSPFAPLITASAIFAPFIARRWAAILSVVVAVSIVIAVLNQSSPRAEGSAEAWVYTAMSLLTITAAGGIAVLQANYRERQVRHLDRRGGVTFEGDSRDDVAERETST